MVGLDRRVGGRERVIEIGRSVVARILEPLPTSPVPRSPAPVTLGVIGVPRRWCATCGGRSW